MYNDGDRIHAEWLIIQSHIEFKEVTIRICKIG